LNLPDPQLLEIYRAEQAEHVQRMRSVVAGISPPHADPAAIEELFRRVHTLKGASRAAGFAATELLLHALEGALAKIRAGELEFTSGLQTLISRALDTIEDILAAAMRGEQPPMIEGLLAEIAEVAETGRIARALAEPSTRGPVEIREPAAAVGASEFVRINADYLDELMSASSEVIASFMGDGSEAARQALLRAEEASREWSSLRQDVAAFLRHHQDDAAFTPIVEFVHSAEKSFQSLLSETRSQAIAQQRLDWDRRRLANQLDQRAARVRIVRADSVFGGFGTMLRLLAKDEGKQIDYRAEGLELPADRVVLQAMKDPVMHLLRNAVSHGVEPAERRARAGKPETAVIRLLIHSQGGRLQITVEDDGKGLDRQALLAEAVHRGLLPANEAEVPDQSLADLIFLPGLSTSSVTMLSGRGMGLAIVQHEVMRFHGEIQVRSQLGQGTTFTLSLPLSVSSQSALLVEVGGHTYAIVSSFVQQLRRVPKSDIQIFEGKPVIVLDSRPVPLSKLSDLLDLSTPNKAGNSDIFQVVVVTAAGRTAALVVDRLADVRDVIVKPLGLPSEKAGLAAGAIALADGSVGLILKTPELLDHARKTSAAQSEALRPAVQEKPVPTILVVDDSMTTRSLEKGLLEAHGYRVRLAVDGVEALESLRRHSVDLVITDLMMPRMDGFQLLEQIRKDRAMAQLPVIIVSSMEDRADQERGLALGADAYITKRKFDQRELLDTVRQIL
jgi:two-component system, chemotaxis family, sensor kinase CheA